MSMSRMEWGNPGQPTDWNFKEGTDANLLIVFYNRPVENAAKSLEAGRRICENQIFVKIQHPGENYNIIDRPANDQDKIRFRRHWSLFVQNREQIPEGTPIDLLFVNYPAVGENLRAYGIYTIEQCANLSAAGIDSIGRGGQEYVNKAKRYIESAEKGKNFHAMQKQIDDLTQQDRINQRTIQQLKEQLDKVLMRHNDPIRSSLTPPFVSGYDAVVDRINNTSPSQEIVRKRKKKAEALPQQITAPASLTDPFAVNE
jgi:hypothetical protein